MLSRGARAYFSLAYRRTRGVTRKRRDELRSPLSAVRSYVGYMRRREPLRGDSAEDQNTNVRTRGKEHLNRRRHTCPCCVER